MREIHTDIEIDAPPERVWQVLTDFDAFAEWNPFVTSVKGDGELKEGARLVIVVRVPDGPTMTFKPRVLKVEPARELRWLGTLPLPGLFNGEHIFQIEPAADGRSRFIHGEHFTGLFIPFMGGVLKKTERGYRLMNEALKQRVEGGSNT